MEKLKQNKNIKSNTTGEKSRNKSIKTIKKEDIDLKRPKTPFFQFCKAYRDNLKKNNDQTKYNAKKLGKIWKSLSDDKKKPYIK